MRQQAGETPRPWERQHLLVLGGIWTLICAGLVVYSQTAAFAWDEGFHLLTAQLIKNGKRPYLDFLFPQTPLNAYWNAAWMRLFGDTWRTAHAVAAVCSSGAVLLTGAFVYSEFPVRRWRFAAALVAGLAVGLDTLVVQFGTIGQAYGFCLLLIVIAFRFTVPAVGQRAAWLAGIAGLFAGTAAASSLLTAPVGPVLLIWILFYNRAGSRLAKLAAFVVGEAIPFVPVLLLWLQNPRLVVYNIIDYHLFYRQVQWADAIPHDIDVMASWLDSCDGLLLVLLSIAGLLFIRFRSNLDRAQRAPYYLCAWVAAALAIHISTAHPTFARYYLLSVPFLAILSVVGLYSIGSRMLSPDRPMWPTTVTVLLLALALGKTLYEGRDDFAWSDFEEIAQKVDEVTPRGAPLLADEHVYFITKRPPPSGMELEDSHKLEVPAAFATWAHIVPGSELKRLIQARTYATVQTCQSEEYIGELGLPKLYRHRADPVDCAVFWELTPSAPAH